MSRGKAIRKKGRSRSSRAGLQFPVSRVMRFLRRNLHKRRISAVAPVYLAAVLEYLVAEVVELAGNAARQNRKRRIIPRHILLAIANDEELHRLLKGVTISMGGVLPNIEPALLIKTKGHKKWIEAKQLSGSVPPTPKPKAPSTPKKSQARKGRKPAANPTPKSKSTKPSSVGKPKGRLSKGTASQASTSVESVSLNVAAEKTLFLGQKLMVINGNVSELSCDAVVHFTNASMYLGGDIGSALLQEGGADFQKEVTDLLAVQGSLSMSEAAICPGHGLQAANVILVNSPSHGTAKCNEKLSAAVKNVLTLADEKHLKSVALPKVSGDFPSDKSARLVMEAVKNYFVSIMASSIKQVMFVHNDEAMIAHYESELESLTSE